MRLGIELRLDLGLDLGLGLGDPHNIIWLTMADDTEKFYYVYSCDLDANVSLKM